MQDTQDIEDYYKDADSHNPYYKVNHDFGEKTSILYKPDEIIKPLNKDIDHDKLREYTNDLLRLYDEDKESNFDILNRQVAKKHNTMFKKTDIYYMYCKICEESKMELSDEIRGFLQSKSFRSQSGVMVYAIFTSPMWRINNDGKYKSFSCKFNCRFCPEQAGHARSYISGEPGEDRARTVDYDTIKQVHVRANTYKATGHINDKAEVLVLGGTWHSYPSDYRRKFIRDLYKAFNTIHERREETYEMEEEIKLNEKSKCRIIGLTIETRPDQITPVSIKEMLKMGITRIQLGIQHTNDRLLFRVQRGYKSEVAIKANKMLKDFNYKVDMHLMPDLPKPFTKEFEEKNKRAKELKITKEDIDWNFDIIKEDYKMFEEIFKSGNYSPDQIKIYPCEVMDWTKIKEDYENGLHIPYGTLDKNQENNPLIELLVNFKSWIPYYCRINRLIRDIPESYILAGISNSSGRQKIAQIMKERGLKCKCIRCREIKKKKIRVEDTVMRITKYYASEGWEYFLEYITKDTESLIGFLRLRVSKSSGKIGSQIYIDELVDTAMIRELHVYGEAINVGGGNSRTQQHMGFGRRLLYSAFTLAHRLGCKRISVISGVGVKEYYRKFGFTDGEYFLIKDIKPEDIQMDLPKIITLEYNKRKYQKIIIIVIVIIILFLLI